MPNLSCSVTCCGHNDDKLCTLNSIDVSGGGSSDNTCCQSFTRDHRTKNMSGNASYKTNIYCQAMDCKYNDECTCVADTIDISTCCQDSSCEDTRCKTFVKRS